MKTPVNLPAMAELRLFNVPERIRIRLKVIAAETSSTLNATAIRALEEWLAQRKPPKLPK